MSFQIWKEKVEKMTIHVNYVGEVPQTFHTDDLSVQRILLLWDETGMFSEEGSFPQKLGGLLECTMYHFNQQKYSVPSTQQPT